MVRSKMTSKLIGIKKGAANDDYTRDYIDNPKERVKHSNSISTDRSIS